MVVFVKIPHYLYQNFFRCDVDLPVVSFYSAPKWGYHLEVGELLVDVRCDISLL